MVTSVSAWRRTHTICASASLVFQENYLGVLRHDDAGFLYFNLAWSTRSKALWYGDVQEPLSLNIRVQ
jgi:hypothetical protein